MKKLEEIVSQTPVYLNSWENKVDIISDFEDIGMDYKDFIASTSPYSNESIWLQRKRRMSEALEKYEGATILFASYGKDNYEGSAYVLFTEEGKLYEVFGSHCSCYGLEEQWEKEEVLLKELEHRLLNGTFGQDHWTGNEFKEELCEFLGVEHKVN